MADWLNPTGRAYVPAGYASGHRPATSGTEILNILAAYAVLTFAIAIASTTLGLFAFSSSIGSLDAILAALPFAAAATLTGFLFHEMAHKVTAQRLGFWSEFRASPVGLLIALITAFAGFLFAAPGATLIGGSGTVEDWGRSAVAGPLTNFIEALIFLATGFAVLVFTSATSLGVTLLSLAFFNGWFAAFNLIPFGPLDGRKVLSWSAPTWVTLFVASAILTAVAFFL